MQSAFPNLALSPLDQCPVPLANPHRLLSCSSSCAPPPPSPAQPWYGRSVIRCCAKLDYPTAQKMIEGAIVMDSAASAADKRRADVPEELWEAARRPTLKSPFSCDDVIQGVLHLQLVAQERRKKRFASGALRLNRPKMSFQLDADANPVGFRQYPIKDSNRLVEEFMLLANYLVAEKLIREAPSLAVLRCVPVRQRPVVVSTVPLGGLI